MPRETIRAIAKLAQRTASWCNSQPWQLTIVGGAALRTLAAALCEHAQTQPPRPDFASPAQYGGIYQGRRRECGLAIYASSGI